MDFRNSKNGKKLATKNNLGDRNKMAQPDGVERLNPIFLGKNVSSRGVCPYGLWRTASGARQLWG